MVGLTEVLRPFLPTVTATFARTDGLRADVIHVTSVSVTDCTAQSEPAMSTLTSDVEVLEESKIENIGINRKFLS
jgi:hypothetical protein